MDLLKNYPEGLTIYEIREKLGITGQQHLDKRVRELRQYYKIILEEQQRYVFRGMREVNQVDGSPVSARLRAIVLNTARGRCQMCGRTILDDSIKLEPDHKVPRNWGGETAIENLWAICQLCNGGKRDFFSSFDDLTMQKIIKMDSVYERLVEILVRSLGQPVPAWQLEFFANINDFQDEWRKRLRELRYPVIGMKIESSRSKTASGKVQSAYTLKEWKALPSDHKSLIKEYERVNKRLRSSTC